MGNWYDDPTTVGRDRLRAILAGIEAPPPPLSREAQVRLLVACHEMQGYLVFRGEKFFSGGRLRALASEGVIEEDDEYGLVAEALG